MSRLLQSQIPQSNYIFNLYNDPRAIPIASSRSCPISCTFCYQPNGKVFRERDLDDFFAEVEHLISTYNINILLVIDDLLSIKKKRLIAFCERIKKYNIKWLCQLHEKVLDEPMIKLLRESGCSFVSIGIESMSDPVLKSMKKLTTSEKLGNALDLIYANDVGIQGNLLFGDPAETLQTAAESFDYWVKHPEYTINFNILQVLPGSEVYKRGVDSGHIDHANAFADPSQLYNLTEMSDELFIGLSRRIEFYNATLLHIGHTEHFAKGETIHPLLKDNGYICHWRCQKCNNINQYENIFLNSWSILLTCRKCLSRANVQLWNHQLMTHTQTDLQYFHADIMDELHQLINSKHTYHAAVNEYVKLLQEKCLPLDLYDKEQKPWSCVRAALKVGQYKLKDGKLEVALPLLMYALLRNIWNPECHAAFGEALEQEGSLGTALLYYKKAIELSKDPFVSWLNKRDELEQIIKEKELYQDKVSLYFNSFKSD
ncbi:MAG: radical SAM protein [Magnetococcales bacterium]|nr:radical SAM protein [Magnetococcales bacterium]